MGKPKKNDNKGDKKPSLRPVPVIRKCKPQPARRINPRNPFILFLAHIRKSMMQKNKDLHGKEGQQEIMRQAGCCWRKMSEAEKDIWRKKACERKPAKPCQRCPTCKRIMPEGKKHGPGPDKKK